MSNDPDLNEFLNVRQDLHEPAPRRPSHPSGWEPGVDTARGVIVAEPSQDPAPPGDWDEILTQFKLDPARWEVVSDAVNVRTWDANLGRDPETGEPCVRRFYYYKANVRPRVRGDRADIDALVKRISSHRYKRPAKLKDSAVSLNSALVVCLADWQTGPDPDGIVDHVLRLKNAIVDRLKTERPVMLYVVGMGDMIEGCDGHYPMQTFTVKLDGRQQVKLVRRLLVDLLTTWARYVPAMVVGCVPGNHGEKRKDGKAYTTFEDNDDLAVFEQAAEILAANPDAYDHVRFAIPDGDMSLTLDVAGTTAGFIHGHQAKKGGSTPRQKIETWWRGKQNGRHPIGDADVLVSGHLHHFVAVEDGPRTWFQCPALARSRWFTEGGGAPTKMGTLTFRCSPDGWDRLEVVR